MRRLIVRALLALLSLVLCLAALLVVLSLSTTGTRWVLGQVPGLSTEQLSGTLAQGITAQKLSWRDEQTAVTLNELVLAWSPSCLWRLALCIDTLQVDSVDIALTPNTAPETDEPINLPDIVLPLAVRLEHFSLGELRLDDAVLVTHVQLKAAANARGLSIESLALDSGELSLQASGQLNPVGRWPLALTGQLKLPDIDQQPWTLHIQADGPLQDSVTVSATSEGYLTAQLAGQVELLKDGLPATAEVRSERFHAAADLPETLILEQVVLNAHGSLKDGYEVSGQASLPAHEQPMAVELQGRVDAEGADVALLKVQAGQQQFLQTQGRLDWREAFAAVVQLNWQHFPWQRLYALDEPLPVELQQLDAELSYQSGNYLGHFTSQLTGPAGAFSVSSPVSGDTEQVTLAQLRVEAGQGQIEGVLGIGFAQGLSWQAALEVSRFDPGYWLAQLPGTLAGTIKTRGQYQADALQLQADIDLKGRLRGAPAQLTALGDAQGANWTLKALKLHVGENQITASAQADQQLKARALVNMPRLGQLWPGLEGALRGTLEVNGSLYAPFGTLELNGQRLAFDGSQVSNLTLNASVDKRQHGDVLLALAGVQVGETDLGQLDLKAQGDLRKQSLQLSLDGPSVEVGLAINGELDQQHNWQGWITDVHVQSAGQHWQLANHARLTRDATGQLQLGAHCLHNGGASVCGAQQQLAPNPQLDWELNDFPLDTLDAWLPEDFSWQGVLNGRMKLALSEVGPDGVVRLNASRGQLRVLESDLDQWVEFPYESLSLDVTLKPHQVVGAFSFDSQRLGQLTLNAQLDPRSEIKPLRGDFSLKHFELEVFRPFIPLAEHLAGELNGQGTLGGSLLAPKVYGVLKLEDGELSGGQLPVSFEALTLQTRIEGDELTLNGDWRSGDAGQATLSGEVNWREGLLGQIGLKAQHLPVTVVPYAELEVDSDLTVLLNGPKVSVSGDVNVPRGAIVVRELPASTVTISSDARIVGQPETVEDEALGVGMNVNVLVGQDKVTFEGFGLKGDLNGRLHIGNDLDTRGEIVLGNGLYSAYGQRLTIRRARVLFTGPIDEPFLDVEATRQVDNVTAGIQLTGSASRPKTTVFSEPAMSEEQALSYLVLGRPVGGGAGDANMLGQAALAIGLAGSSSITTGLASRLGIKDFQLDTEGSGVTTSVVASGELTDKLSLRYGVGIFEPNGIIALRYQLTRKWYVEAASGFSSSLDVFYRTQW